MEGLWFGVFGALLLFTPVVIIFPVILTKVFKRQLSRKAVALLFGGLTIVSFVLFASSLNEESFLNYEVVKKENGQTVENVDVLIKPGEPEPQKIAEKVKKECKKPCNISLYNDRKAFELQDQYDQMMSALDTKPSDLDNWNSKNYIYVANHLVGYMEFSQGLYNEYPLKDSYYEEMKSEEVR